MAVTLPSTRRPRFLGEAPAPRGPQAATFPRGDSDGQFDEAQGPASPPEPPRLAARSAPRPTPAPPAAPSPAASPAARDSSEQLGAAIEALRLIGGRLAEQARSDALEIAFQIARRILETELTASPQPLFALVRSAVRRVGEAREISVRLSPADAALVEAQPKSELGLSLGVVKIVPDPTLERGDCVVESDLGTVDGRLGNRLTELKRSLAEALAGDAA